MDTVERQLWNDIVSKHLAVSPEENLSKAKQQALALALQQWTAECIIKHLEAIVGKEAEELLAFATNLHERFPMCVVGGVISFPQWTAGESVLKQMNNICIEMIMRGKPLPLDSDDSIALAAYVTSLSNGTKIQVGGK